MAKLTRAQARGHRGSQATMESDMMMMMMTAMKGTVHIDAASDTLSAHHTRSFAL